MFWYLLKSPYDGIQHKKKNQHQRSVLEHNKAHVHFINNTLQDWRRTRGFHDQTQRQSRETPEENLESVQQLSTGHWSSRQRNTASQEECYENRFHSTNYANTRERLGRKRVANSSSQVLESDLPPQQKFQKKNNKDCQTNIPMVVDDTDPRINMATNFVSRPRPNFRIKYDHLSEKLKVLCRVMRKIPDTATLEQINEHLSNEFLQHNLNVDHARSFERIRVVDAVSAIQDAWLDLISWDVKEWNAEGAKEKAQSQLEACFDLVINIWHHLIVGSLGLEMNNKV
ncbi:hypothetical protein PVAND_008446 [Polypedilum vanderplanki]|uniref:Uncharacterized protein n=1 Tax=Polypedilum vanderplanki TaxID=319348 RepID=A0A9J6C9J8_POLVA|nr:hypothetical protein PVAND_008446 [Polypedilum vanderplanki]